ncbi:hypothetical protein NDU88_006295 [Pleurodeles waltl]|uniref:Uncharacterized protein n=1 Tax=Pleurodeles waltl TaxID=8319 RepID=A0AAV7WX78_PLEWA|nr:hypothetical protein NDU88_006295 [Pleurodeles waltl]
MAASRLKTLQILQQRKVLGTSPLAGDVPQSAGGCRVVSLAKDRKQALLAARVAVEEKGCCPGPGRTRMSPLGRGDREGPQQHREPTHKKVAPTEALEHRFKQSEHGGRLNTAKVGPRSRRSTQGAEHCRTEWWGPGLGCAGRISWKCAQKP